MTAIAPHVTAFFQERLTLERRASVHTSDSYAYAFRLLLNFASKQLNIAPSHLQLEQIDAPLVVTFLRYLEESRSNSASSRNVRLALRRSSRSCTSSSTGCPQLLSRFDAFSRFRRKRPIHVWYGILRPQRFKHF